MSEKAVAFEMEIEVFWCSVLDRLPPGSTADVWLHTDWTLRRTHGRGASRVGVFRKDIPLKDFREACFATLEEWRLHTGFPGRVRESSR